VSVYTPSQFDISDRAAIARLMHDHPFATVVTPVTPEPQISHLPLLLVPGCEPHGTLLGHMARANPHWRDIERVESTAIFQGPHAYVSPAWYAEPARGVPTWNYAVVHACGMLEIIDDPVATRRVLDALVHRFEGTRDNPWQFAMPEEQRDALVGAIVAFRMRIRRLPENSSCRRIARQPIARASRRRWKTPVTSSRCPWRRGCANTECPRLRNDTPEPGRRRRRARKRAARQVAMGRALLPHAEPGCAGDRRGSGARQR
jgi:transcriptional regulator